MCLCGKSHTTGILRFYPNHHLATVSSPQPQPANFFRHFWLVIEGKPQVGLITFMIALLYLRISVSHAHCLWIMYGEPGYHVPYKHHMIHRIKVIDVSSRSTGSRSFMFAMLWCLLLEWQLSTVPHCSVKTMTTQFCEQMGEGETLLVIISFIGPSSLLLSWGQRERATAAERKTQWNIIIIKKKKLSPFFIYVDNLKCWNSKPKYVVGWTKKTKTLLALW